MCAGVGVFFSVCACVCNDVGRVLMPGVYCCHLRPCRIICTVSTLTVAHTHMHKVVAGVYLVRRAKQEVCLCGSARMFVCLCTSTGVSRLIKFISSGHVAVGNPVL